MFIANTFYEMLVLVLKATCFANLTLKLSTTRYFDVGLGTASAIIQNVLKPTVPLFLASKSSTAQLKQSSMHLRIPLSIT